MAILETLVVVVVGVVVDGVVVGGLVIIVVCTGAT